ncbi:hypothetical protein [Phytohabitans houttuyneae]|uniref:Uncharacterized protein n=1 Tax=Phytohabitans houttuyneae TaxID=1076126 RepID=A0A6V8KBY8_9ACTN|nr:hypothetical protein [Phytohabitans houttuyneae]GFJ79506.1 hypothetical protein Phou_036860 [Phytohabitans houttuyneae]
MSRVVAEQFQRYVDRMPGARAAYVHDATYAAQMKFIRRMLYTVDLALETEGVAEDVRQRVTRMVLFGSPDPDAADDRAREHERLMTAVMADVRKGPASEEGAER